MQVGQEEGEEPGGVGGGRWRGGGIGVQVGLVGLGYRRGGRGEAEGKKADAGGRGRGGLESR